MNSDLGSAIICLLLLWIEDETYGKLNHFDKLREVYNSPVWKQSASNVGTLETGGRVQNWETPERSQYPGQLHSSKGYSVFTQNCGI